MRKGEKEARAAARKRREVWMAEVDQRWAAFVAQRIARPNLWAASSTASFSIPTAFRCSSRN
jgi:hypothetical protein